MEFTKTTRPTKKVYQVKWVRKEFVEMSESYRKIRLRCKRKMDRCVKCRHQFQNGEMMGLAHLEKWNRVICGNCANELLAQVRE